MSKDMSETEPKEHQLVSALTGASENGNANTVKLLLDKGVPVDSFDKYGMTALMRASQRGRIDIVRLLLDRGAQVDVIGACTGELLSRINCIAPGRRDLIEKLQGGGVFTALILASGSGHTEVVRLLLDRNTLIDAVDFNGWTALISASSYGHVEVVSLLIEKGAQVNFQSSDRSGTALIAASEEGQLSVVKLLLQKGADVNIYAKEGVTALMKATKHGHIDIVMLLLDKGAIVDFQQTQGATALMIACTLGHKNIIRALINHGADMYKDNDEGKSALTLAANRESDDIFSVLMESADRDTRSQATKKEEKQSQVASEFEDIQSQATNEQIQIQAISKEIQSKAAFQETECDETELADEKSESDTEEDKQRDKVQAESQSEDKDDSESLRQKVAGASDDSKLIMDSSVGIQTKYFPSKEADPTDFLDEAKDLYCDSSGLEHKINEYDITIKIAVGSIPEGKEIHLTIGATLNSPFKSSSGKRPISPVLWLCPAEEFELSKPIEVTLPHILSNKSIVVIITD